MSGNASVKALSLKHINLLNSQEMFRERTHARHFEGLCGFNVCTTCTLMVFRVRHERVGPPESISGPPRVCHERELPNLFWARPLSPLCLLFSPPGPIQISYGTSICRTSTTHLSHACERGVVEVFLYKIRACLFFGQG